MWGIEVGGRWTEEAASFITNLAQAKTLDPPAPLRHATTSSLFSRWTAFLTHAALTAFAASLTFEDPPHRNLDGEPPPLRDLLAPRHCSPVLCLICEWALPLDFTHMETSPHTNSPNAWKLHSKAAHWDPIAAKCCVKKNDVFVMQHVQEVVDNVSECDIADRCSTKKTWNTTAWWDYCCRGIDGAFWLQSIPIRVRSIKGAEGKKKHLRYTDVRYFAFMTWKPAAAKF